jgi:hypothetical protein
MLKMYVTQIPEVTDELTTAEAIWECMKALMGAQIAKDKSAQRRLKKALKELEAAEKEEANGKD